MKIVVLNEDTQTNTSLIVNVLGRRNSSPLSPDIPKLNETLQKLQNKITSIGRGLNIDDGTEDTLNEGGEEVDSSLIDDTHKRSKLPFANLFKRGSKTTNRQIPKSVSFDRLPAFLPRNSVLIGGYNNEANFVPAPENDSEYFLVFKKNKIQWMKAGI